MLCWYSAAAAVGSALQREGSSRCVKDSRRNIIKGSYKTKDKMLLNSSPDITGASFVVSAIRHIDICIAAELSNDT